MIGFNGGLIGGLANARDTSLLSAVGVWTLNEQRKAKLANLWPIVAEGVAATGGTAFTITDGGLSYRVHTFTSNGSFVVAAGGEVQYLVVAGGGGGGGTFEGGGGGAGGLLSGTTTAAITTYSITVGTGGAGGTATVRSANGGDSVFDTFTAIGGGGGASSSPTFAANTGGSGGGGTNVSIAGAAGTAGQGFAGGDGRGADAAGGGGGGAGGVGTTALAGVAQPAGGVGVPSTYRTGLSTTYATGGNGARRADNVTGTAGAANTGNGGGGSAGSSGTTVGAAGGSGIVIIRYLITADPDFTSITLLLHLNGTNGSTDFTGADTSSSPKTLTPVGSAQISTAESKFGQSLLLNTANDYANYLTTPDNVGFQFGTGAFTMEAWIYLISKPRNIAAIIATNTASFTTGSYYFVVDSSNKLQFGGSGVSALISTSTISTGQWYHVAASRSGTTTRIFINGTLEDTETSDTTSYNFSTNNLLIGRNGWDSSGTQGFHGYIDDVRITKGVARYIASFAPPAVPFFDS